MNKLIALLNRDINDKNELKKTAVATRYCCLLMIIYASVFATISLLDGSTYGAVAVCTMIVGYAIAMKMTYGKDIQRACVTVDIITAIGIITTVIWFGWNSGIQHFLFALVLFNILFVRMSIRLQMFGAVGICALRLTLYFYCKAFDPLFVFSSNIVVVVQIISTIFVFMIIIACGVNYAIENQNTENTIRKHNKELEKIASTDPLTQLWNRHKMLEYIDEYLTDNGSVFCSVSICDIDFFKKINDTYGHEGGDKILVTLAELLNEEMLNQGAVARWGGEEFLLFFDGLNGDEALMKLSDIRSKIKKMVVPYNDNEIKFTMTFGLVEYDKELSFDQNIKVADDRLYLGKQGGRDQIVY